MMGLVEQKIVKEVSDAVRRGDESSVILARQGLSMAQRRVLLGYAADLRSSYSRENNTMIPGTRDGAFELERERMGEKTIDYLVKAAKIRTPITQEGVRSLSYRSF